MNILFTCAGRRTYLLKYFKNQIGKNGLIVGGDMQLSAPALSAADVKLQLPAVYDMDYVPFLINVCKNYDIKAVISLNDLELPILALNRQRFLSEGVFPIVSDLAIINMCFDKKTMANYVSGIGLQTPKSCLTPKEAISNGLEFPLLLKPRWGSGSIGVEVVDDCDELMATYSFLKKKIMKSILSTASDSNNPIIIQEFIKGTEYGLDIINDLNGNYVTTSVKRKISMRAGETDKAENILSESLTSIGEIIGTSTRHIANLDCDILEKDGVFYVIDLNPRFGGGFPFSYEAGVNLPLAIIKWLNNEPVDAGKMLTPTIGHIFSKCDYLVKVK